jgi:hypothetical protein
MRSSVFVPLTGAATNVPRTEQSLISHPHYIVGRSL